MQTTLRMFALLVAVAGLGTAAMIPAASHAQPNHLSILTSSPIAAAFPQPCSPYDCVASMGSNTVSGR